MIAHVLRAVGLPTFATTSMGTTIDGDAQPDPATLRALYDLLEAAHRRGVRHAAIEVTSRALADGYAKRWRFDLGVFTNLSPDHFATHGSWENYLAAKAQLFVHLGPGCTAVLNAGDEASLLLDQAIPDDVTRRWFHAPARGGVRHAPVDLQAVAVAIGLTGTDVELAPSELATQLGGRLSVPLVGEVFAENALAAATACLAIGIAGD